MTTVVRCALTREPSGWVRIHAFGRNVHSGWGDAVRAFLGFCGLPPHLDMHNRGDGNWWLSPAVATRMTNAQIMECWQTAFEGKAKDAYGRAVKIDWDSVTFPVSAAEVKTREQQVREAIEAGVQVALSRMPA